MKSNSSEQKQFSTKIMGVIPLVLPYFENRNFLLKPFESGINEIVLFCNKKNVKFMNNFEGRLKARLLKTVDELEVFKKYWKGPPSILWEFWFLEISITFEFTMKDVKEGLKANYEMEFQKKIDLYKAIAAFKIEDICNDILVSITIAKFGLIKASEGAIFYDDKTFLTNVNGTHNIFFWAKEKAQKINWPPTYDLPLEMVYNWLERSGLLKTGIGEGKIGRAVAAITHMLKNDFSHVSDNLNLDIIWSLIGLEAIYGNGNSGLKSQLVEKSRIFLGEPSIDKKFFGRAYDLRSRVIHGDVDIPFKNYHGDTNVTLGKSIDLEDARLITAAVLISTVQKFIIEDKADLVFKYQIA